MRQSTRSQMVEAGAGVMPYPEFLAEEIEPVKITMDAAAKIFLELEVAVQKRVEGDMTVSTQEILKSMRLFKDQLIALYPEVEGQDSQKIVDWLVMMGTVLRPMLKASVVRYHQELPRKNRRRRKVA